MTKKRRGKPSRSSKRAKSAGTPARNRRIDLQTRKLLGKHYASKYRAR